MVSLAYHVKIFSTIKTIFLDLLFPVFCFGCKKEGVFLCGGCKNKLVWIQPACFGCNKWVQPSLRIGSGTDRPGASLVYSPGAQFSRGAGYPRIMAGRTCLSCRKKSPIYAFLSPFLYSNTLVRSLIHGLKYDRLRSLSDLLGGLLVEYIAKFNISFPANTLLVPVPLYPSRFRKRGFNQAEQIVLYLSDRLKIKSDTKALQKIRQTKAQVELSAQDRCLNLIGAFMVFDSSRVKNKTILLVDDVKTTGSTLKEAARILKAAGAGRIVVLTVAH